MVMSPYTDKLTIKFTVSRSWYCNNLKQGWSYI